MVKDLAKKIELFGGTAIFPGLYPSDHLGLCLTLA